MATMTKTKKQDIETIIDNANIDGVTKDRLIEIKKQARIYPDQVSDDVICFAVKFLEKFYARGGNLISIEQDEDEGGIRMYSCVNLPKNKGKKWVKESEITDRLVDCEINSFIEFFNSGEANVICYVWDKPMGRNLYCTKNNVDYVIDTMLRVLDHFEVTK